MVSGNGSKRTIVEVSHVIESGMITYKGLPAPVVCDYLTREESRKFYAPGTEFQIGKVEMVSNTGTYIDSPFHRYPHGDDLAALSAASILDIEAVVVRVPKSQQKIGPEAFSGIDVSGKAVLVHTGWDAHWRTDQYFENHPFLTGPSAELLTRRGATLVGIDSLNIDDTNDGTRPVHTTLLAKGIPIVEHLCNLDGVADDGARFFAPVLKIKSCGTFPVRAFAINIRR